MKKQKEIRERSLFFDLKLIGFLFRKASEVSRSLWITMSLLIIAKATSPLLWIIMPKFILDELMGQARMDVLLTILLLFLVSVFILEGLAHVLQAHMEVVSMKSVQHCSKILGQKVMEMDYAYLEDAEILDLKDKALHGLNYWGGIRGLTECCVSFLSSAITLLTLVSMILLLSPILTVLLIAVILCITFLNNKIRVLVYTFWDKLMVFNRKFRYVIGLMFDHKYAKDLRLFHMEKLLLQKNREYNHNTHEYYKKQGDREQLLISIKDLVNFVQMMLVYGFTVYLAFTGEIAISSMVMYISAATGMVTASTAITQSIIDLKRVCQYSAPFFELCHLKPLKSVGKEKVAHSSTWEIEFQNVSFTYPHTDTQILKNVSIKITAEQKLSIVGLNGAGKTTFVKLLLRLYDPDEGRILLNGIDIKDLDYGEYMELFSVVFQDYQLFAGSIAENIAVSDQYTEQNVEQVLDKVNLLPFVRQLPEKSETQLLRIFDEKGIELSGGQASRVAIARAVYKNAPFVVLDEPTAALDPLAEYEIYRNFNDLVCGKTTIYISHRLSSCRFCDAIAVFENGCITEYGSHDQLLENPDGIYAKMWHAQSQYYI